MNTLKSFFKLAIPLFVTVLFTSNARSQASVSEVKVQTLGGIEVKVNDIIKNNSEPVILFTYFNNCEVCVEALEILHEEMKRYRFDGFKFKVIGLNVYVPEEDAVMGIKEFAISKGWTFDIYMDPENNIRTYHNKSETRAPYSYLFKDGKLIYSKLGWIEEDAEKTANNLINAAKSIGSKLVYYDEDWNYANKTSHFYFRTVDHIDDGYYVQDRWADGSLQMQGFYKDKELTVREGKFTYYEKIGSKTKETVYRNNELVSEKNWYTGEKLKNEFEYKNGMIYNILYTYDLSGNKVDHGSIKNGTGSVILYNDFGDRATKYHLENGEYTGEYITYMAGKVDKKYKRKGTEWVEI
ncbi:redoxin domain-containing protein [Gramella sp. BOM4]|nr:redoxin domain-containing protein [Christiangramia bathymodioli]